MRKTTKRLVALLLAISIMSMQIVYNTTTVKAVGAVATASALWEALTAASGAYAGYSLTNKQNKTVTQQLATYLSDFADTVIDAPWDHLSSVSDFTSWMVAEIVPKNGVLTKDSAYLLTKAFCDQAGNTIDGVKKHAVVLEKNVKKIETAKPTNPKDDDDGGLLPALLKEIALNIAADGAINAGKKFIKFCGTLTDLIIKDNLNAEYIKGKGKWDWEALGFKTDYDTVNISNQDGSKFKDINNATGIVIFNYNHTLIETSDGKYKHVIYLPCGTEKTALITIHNPNNDKWITCVYPENALYEKMADVKAGNLSCEDIIKWVNEKSYSHADYSDVAVENLFAFDEFIYKSNYGWITGACFPDTIYDRKEYDLPLHVTLWNLDDEDYTGTAYLSKANTTVYNLGVTANIYYINFTSNTEFTGATTALNGTETMQPTVKPSKYTNTAEQVDKQSDTITINNYVINNYSNTDNVINNIANDNDLTLDSKDDDDSGTSSDYTALLKSILSTLKNVPKNTYKYFSNKLDMIITAIQAGNSEDVISVINKLNNPMDKMISQLTNLNELVSKIDGKEINIKDIKVDFDVQNYASTVSQEINNVLVKVFMPGDTYINNKYEEINVEMQQKLGYQEFTNFFDDIKEIKEAKPTNITFNTSSISNMFGGGGSSSSDGNSSDPDSEITILNFDIYYKYKDDVDKIIRGIMFFTLLVFNIRHIYILIRGSDMLGGE